MSIWNRKKLKSLRESPNQHPWDDLKFPFSGQRLDSASTRYSFDFYNGGIIFDSDARYPNEKISAIAQMPHEWLEEDAVRPHIHWIQSGASDVNWLLAYKHYQNGAECTEDTNYNNHTLVAGSPSFDLSVFPSVQISTFGDVVMKGYRASCMLHCVIFRDSANASGLFAGTDSGLNQTGQEFDIHYRKRGSSGINNFLGTYFEFFHLSKEMEADYGSGV